MANTNSGWSIRVTVHTSTALKHICFFLIILPWFDDFVPCDVQTCRAHLPLLNCSMLLPIIPYGIKLVIFVVVTGADGKIWKFPSQRRICISMISQCTMLPTYLPTLSYHFRCNYLCNENFLTTLPVHASLFLLSRDRSSRIDRICSYGKFCLKAEKFKRDTNLELKVSTLTMEVFTAALWTLINDESDDPYL